MRSYCVWQMAEACLAMKPTVLKIWRQLFGYFPECLLSENGQRRKQESFARQRISKTVGLKDLLHIEMIPGLILMISWLSEDNMDCQYLGLDIWTGLGQYLRMDWPHL